MGWASSGLTAAAGHQDCQHWPQVGGLTQVADGTVAEREVRPHGMEAVKQVPVLVGVIDLRSGPGVAAPVHQSASRADFIGVVVVAQCWATSSD